MINMVNGVSMMFLVVVMRFTGRWYCNSNDIFSHSDLWPPPTCRLRESSPIEVGKELCDHGREACHAKVHRARSAGARLMQAMYSKEPRVNLMGPLGWVENVPSVCLLAIFTCTNEALFADGEVGTPAIDPHHWKVNALSLNDFTM